MDNDLREKRIKETQSLHESQESNAKKWSMMLVDPSTHCVRAPSLAPLLASKARFVRTLEIPYALTTNGSFAVAMFPSAAPSYGFTGPPLNVPPVAGDIWVYNSNAPGGLPTTFGTNPLGFPDSGYYFITPSSADAPIGTVGLVPDLSIVSPALNGLSGIPTTVALASNISISISPLPGRSFPPSLFARAFRITNAFVQLPGAAVALNVTGNTQLLAPTAGSDLIYWTVQLVTAGGGVALPSTPFTCVLYAHAVNGLVPAGAYSNSFNLVKSELTDVASISHVRATAMSMLVTSMAAPIDAGGELVIARTRKQILAESFNPLTIMNNIRKLPEQLYWRSGPIIEGAYSWYLPDDVESYEPSPFESSATSDNFLIVAGSMANPNGYVRIILTWIFEFYTPAQLFTRDYNSSWSPAHRDSFDLLLRRSACSANLGHAALISAVGTAALSAYEFYKAHEAVIDPLVSTAFNAVVARVAKKRKPKPRKAQSLPKK